MFDCAKDLFIEAMDPRGGDGGVRQELETGVIVIEERAASEEEMVLEFLKSEGGVLISNADLSDVEQNAARARMLENRRGYTSRRALFKNFPRDVCWRLSKLTSEDFERLRYVNSSPWRPLAGPELRVVDGASRIGENVFDQTIDGIERCASKIQDMVQSLRNGDDFTSALILADVWDGRLVVIEGNHRATAFVIANVGRPIAALMDRRQEWARGRTRVGGEGSGCCYPLRYPRPPEFTTHRRPK